MRHNLIFVIFILTISCNEKTDDFNKYELECYNVYNIGDSLIFQSSITGKLKKYLIVDKNTENSQKKDAYYSETKVIRAYITCQDLDKLPVDINNEKGNLLDISNDIDGNTIFIGLVDYLNQYENNLGTLNHHDTLNLLNKKIIDYYELYYDKNQTGDYPIAKMIWQQKYGIVKYDLTTGESFIKINMP